MRKTTKPASCRPPAWPARPKPPLGWLLGLLALLAGPARAQPAQPDPAAHAPAVFLRAVASPASVYVGQALSVGYLLYYRVPVIDPGGETALKFGSCYVAEYPPAPAEHTETIGGQAYRVRVLKQYLLIPQLAGALQLPVLAQRYRRQEAPAESDFFGEPKIVSATVRSAALRVPVRALPPPPDSLPVCHAVGQLSCQPSYTVSGKADNLLTVRLRVRGPASLQRFRLPPPLLPAGVEAFNSQNQEQHQLTAKGLRASGTYSYDLVASYRGTYRIPGFAFQYFDPAAGRYVTYRSPAFRWLVTKGAPRPPAPLPAAGPLLYTKPSLAGPSAGHLFVGSRAYYGVLACGLLFFVAGLGYARRAQARATHHRRYRFRKARQWALRAIARNARAHPHDPDQLCKGLLSILLDYAENKFGLAKGGLLAGGLAAALQARAVPASTQARTLDFAARLARLRFAPGPPAPAGRFHSEELAAIIKELDQYCRYE